MSRLMSCGLGVAAALSLSANAAAGARQFGAVGIVTYDPIPYTETQTTPVPVPYAWLDEHVTGVAHEYEAYEASAKATAANGRKVWACYLLGLDPSDPLDDFRITAFWMDGDMPMFELSHTTDGGGRSILPYVSPLGKTTLDDQWHHVPDGGNPDFRFFAVEVVPPGVESIVDEGVQLWANGPYWARRNVGATRTEEYGYYFWWGDTVGYVNTGGGWVSVQDGTGIEFSQRGTAASTYLKDEAALRSEGYIDATGNLTAAHDAARAHLGSPWRMPTHTELSDLTYRCTATWITTNGVHGKLYTGRGDYADRSIFLPSTGYVTGSKNLDAGKRGNYWSSTADLSTSTGSWDINTDNLGAGSGGRFVGLSVRPVRDPD